MLKKSKSLKILGHRALSLVYLIFFLHFLVLSAFGQSQIQKTTIKNSAENFQVVIYDKYVTIKSPSVFQSPMAFLIENKSTSKIIGYLRKSDGLRVETVTIFPESFQSLSFPFVKDEVWYWGSLSPGSEEFMLKVGQPFFQFPEIDL
jgi:hypothetical protein